MTQLERNSNYSMASREFIWKHGKTMWNVKAVGTYRHHSTHRTPWNDKQK